MATGAGKGTGKAKLSDLYFFIFSMRYSSYSPFRTTRILSSAKWCLPVERRILRTSFSASTYVGGAKDFRLIFTLLGVTMSQKSSVTQFASLVSWALTPDSIAQQSLSQKNRSRLQSTPWATRSLKISGLHIACANSVRHAYQPQEDFMLTLIKGLFRKDSNCLWPKF